MTAAFGAIAPMVEHPSLIGGSSATTPNRNACARSKPRGSVAIRSVVVTVESANMKLGTVSAIERE
jgi:hypothetical protein